MMKQKQKLLKIGISGVLLLLASFLSIPEQTKVFLYLLSYVIAGGDILLAACKNIFYGKIFDENFLMSIATLGAMLIKEYPEGVAVMLFYQLGEFFQGYAVNKSRDSIASLMDICPTFATLLKKDTAVQVGPEEVEVGDIILIKPGERIPLDAILLEGSSFLDTAALTGESIPMKKSPGDSLLSGCINLDSPLKAKVTKIYEESTVAKILDLVENASDKKSTSEHFITKFSRYYTPIVALIAFLLGTIPPLLFPHTSWGDWVYRGLIFLVISCPCALVISIPLGFFAGIGGASKQGVLVKGSNYLEALAQAKTIVFDKTGTLTKGIFQVNGIYPTSFSEEVFLEKLAHIEMHSNHPISISIQKAYGKPFNQHTLTEMTEISGYGIQGKLDGIPVLAGNHKLMEQHQIVFSPSTSPYTIIYLAVNGVYEGYIEISDELKEDASLAIKGLKELGISNTVMLTGDKDTVAHHVATTLGLDCYYAQLLPQDKVAYLETLLTAQAKGEKLAFVGDGMNDAPCLARADIGIAMGGLGSDAAIEAADIVIMTDEPSKIIKAIEISQKTLRVVKQNIILALGVKLFVLCLGAFGLATMWEAVFADVGVSVLAILNAMSVMNLKKS